MERKKLIYFLSHIDDFEISCLGYFFKYHADYSDIHIIIATTWAGKEQIWEQNILKLKKHSKTNIKYTNLQFQQRRMMSQIDEIKDKFYSLIDWGGEFDLITHSPEDCHTDHVAASIISNGVYKYASRFITVYSPSTVNFSPNFWIPLTDQQFFMKSQMCDEYEIQNEQSYSKSGYYLQSNEHYNIGKAYQLENFTRTDFNHYECYFIKKWI